jgi:predicted RNA binding protein YcfA (HicA-like mRNA interferase family)
VSAFDRRRSFGIGGILPAEVTRRQMERWLLEHGFQELPGKKTSHRQYEGHGIKIALPGHGPQDLTKKHVALIVRQLVAAGFDRARVLHELKG